MDLGENVEVSVNIEERVERRAWVTFSTIYCWKGKWDICLCFFCKSFYLCGFLPAAQLVVDSVVGPGQLNWHEFNFWWSIQFWWCLFFSRWYNGTHTCFSSTLLLAGQSFVRWGLATTCVKFIFSFLDFAKDLRKWSRVFSAPCMEIVESSEWWKYCKLKKVVIGEQGNQIDAQSR